MIAVLIVLALMWWSLWLVWRHVRLRLATVTVVLPERIIQGVRAHSYESDCVATQVVQITWTVLDDLQLTRLLSESAPSVTRHDGKR